MMIICDNIVGYDSESMRYYRDTLCQYLVPMNAHL